MDMDLSSLQYLEGKDQLLHKNHKPLWSRIQQTICCWSSESDEDLVDEDKQSLETRKTLRETMNLQQKQIKNELQIIGIHLNICLAKLTQKNFFVDLQQLKAKLKIKRISKLKSNLTFDADQFFVNKGTIFFSLFNDGIMMRQGEMDWAIPEKVVKYLVERTKIIDQAYVLDAFSYSGSVAIQMSKACNTAFVISLSDNDEDLSNSTINRNIYDSVDKLDFIGGSFERIGLKIKPDLVFLYPPNKWNLLIGLKKAISLCSNIILVLSSLININEVGEVLSQLKVVKVEFQIIQVDGNIRYYVVFIGDVALLDMQDEYQFLCFYLMSDTNNHGFYDRLYQLLKIVSQQMNFDEILSLAKECKIETENSSETIVQRFIHRMMELRVDLKEMIMMIFKNIDLDLLLKDTPQINNSKFSSMTFNPKNDSSTTYTQQIQQVKFRQQNKLETPSFQVNE